MASEQCILVVDDEAPVRDLIESIVSAAGYRVASAANGLEALEALDSQQVDLVITDVLMPMKEGIETIIEIRKRRPEIPIVAISGGGWTSNLFPLSLAGKLGADVTLPKPFEPSELLEAIEESRSRATMAGPGRQAWLGEETLANPHPK